MFDDSALRRRTLLAALAGAAAVPLLGGRAQAASPKVYIDPGHGGTDPGAVGNGLQEKALTLDISLQLRTILQANWAVDVRMSRTTDITRSLAYRTDDANAWGANLFVSVHINSGGGTGFESYRYPTADAATVNLHNAVHPKVLAAMRSVGSVTDRGPKTANFHVLRETTMPAVLTENLFIDTLADANLLKRADFITAIARGHADGIATYLGLGSPNPPTFSVIVDNATAGRFTASTNWGTSAYSSQRYGADYRFATPTPASDAAWFKVDIPAAGNYRIEVRHPADPGYSSAAPHVVVTSAGNQTVNVDQRSNGGVWRSLGTFPLAAGDRNLLAVSRWTNATGYVVADAVRVTRV
ncbi:N-acetylmuramoyl-L-alanine amidase [Micromonospora sp. C28SCA-DRY-2]|uniref:golvesin C-terminal-like domain-containing protein n=1 Tax=Micromonospora sp. C28SCA-DRY-2 TaxID=3059522 RepID=UPI002676B01B|nr:N-acetylmuramoyl-L-alanine amidase [Micromonospora sp. C28SCA-DRY-2]MDO3705934.1 N-acetylmuramoyl-L-alanine amidase [Micromonospora sp. C28SCA-DRY-2]